MGIESNFFQMSHDPSIYFFKRWQQRGPHRRMYECKKKLSNTNSNLVDEKHGTGIWNGFADHFKVKAAKTVVIPKEFLNAIQMQSIPVGNNFSFSV